MLESFTVALVAVSCPFFPCLRMLPAAYHNTEPTINLPQHDPLCLLVVLRLYVVVLLLMILLVLVLHLFVMIILLFSFCSPCLLPASFPSIPPHTLPLICPLLLMILSFLPITLSFLLMDPLLSPNDLSLLLTILYFLMMMLSFFLSLVLLLYSKGLFFTLCV